MIPEIAVSFSDGSFITRQFVLGGGCVHCGTTGKYHFTYVGVLDTTPLGLCCSLRCAERRTKRLGLR